MRPARAEVACRQDCQLLDQFGLVLGNRRRRRLQGTWRRASVRCYGADGVQLAGLDGDGKSGAQDVGVGYGAQHVQRFPC